MVTEASLRKQVATWLDQYLSIKEGSTEHKAILAVFNDSGLCSRYRMTTNDAWCATAVSAAFIACGLSSIFPCVECSCANMITLAKAAGIWVEDDSYTPSIGDVIMYDWQDSGSGDNTGTPDHVGIVYSISGTSMKIIEGNKSDTVAYRTMQVNGKFIRGYITPKYSSVATSSDSSASGSGSLTAGAKVTLSGVSVYNTASTTTSAGTRSGEYYIWSAQQVSGRIRLTNSKDNVGVTGKVSFWVSVADISGTVSGSDSVTYVVGDKVKVSGTIYGNGNGSGGSIKISGETMYIVNLESSSKYTYYIGVAAKKGGTRQGWTNSSTLTKL